MDAYFKQDKPSRDKIFVSWAKDQSRAYAKVFFNWFKEHVDKNAIFFSERDIERGKAWKEQVLDGLKESKVVVAFVTNEAVRHSRWMEAEATAVRFCGEDTLFFPLLIDLDFSDIPDDSCWRTIHGDLTFKSHNEPSYIMGMMKQILEVIQPSTVNDPHFKTELAEKVRILMDKWDKLKELFPDQKHQLRGPASVINAFKNDSEFADWAYQYHRIIHHARDLVVHLLDRYSHMDNPYQVLQETLPRQPLQINPPLYPSHQAMVQFRLQISDMLNILEVVFKRLVEGSGATVWICLRDLRADNHYHNFIRSVSFPGSQGRDESSTPWPLQGKTITTLLETTAPSHFGDRNARDIENRSGQNCTIITDPSKDSWPPYSLERDPSRKQSILGAVLLRKVGLPGQEPAKAGMWWILCVNSDKGGIFTEAHQRILQSCNDAFSMVANAMLRTSTKKSSEDNPVSAVDA